VDRSGNRPALNRFHARVTWIRLGVFAVLASSIGALADDLASLEQKLRAEYVGKTLLIRHFYSGSELRYDAQGQLVKGGPPEPWTVAYCEINDLRLKADRLEIEGKRVAVAFTESEELRRAYISKQKIRADLPPSAGEASAQQALQRIFMLSTESLLPYVPQFWHSFLSRRPWVAGTTPPAHGTVEPSAEPEVPPGVTPPRTLHAPEPKYPLVARQAAYEGTTKLQAVINDQGLVQELSILKPAGFGLDEEAVAAITRWRFEPAKRDGQPIEVETTIVVNFRIRRS
jgi:TonB family protein